VIVASGAKYRNLNVPECARFEGRGVHYAATAMEAELCRGEEAIVVGGGNSAGQAVVYLSQTCSKVHMLVRSGNLSSSMSNYLIERIQASPRTKIHFETEITRFIGSKDLEAVECQNVLDHRTRIVRIRTVFAMIGADPNTDWLRGCIDLDEKGFVLTGKSQFGIALPFETTQPGIFAVGDVRAKSVKRVASAVGEGSVVIQWIHQYLGRMRSTQKREAA